jgi:hypothetical protein
MSTISSPAQKIDPLDSAVSFLIGWCDSLASKNANISNSIPGVQRFDAHRFYLMKRMSISTHHFTLKL